MPEVLSEVSRFSGVCTELQPYMYVEWVTMYEEAVAKLTTQVYTVICRHHLHEL